MNILSLTVRQGFPGGSVGKESASKKKKKESAAILYSILGLPNARDLGSIPGLGRYPGKRNGYPLQYSGLENSKD